MAQFCAFCWHFWHILELYVTLWHFFGTISVFWAFYAVLSRIRFVVIYSLFSGKIFLAQTILVKNIVFCMYDPVYFLQRVALSVWGLT